MVDQKKIDAAHKAGYWLGFNVANDGDEYWENPKVQSASATRHVKNTVNPPAPYTLERRVLRAHFLNGFRCGFAHLPFDAARYVGTKGA